MMMVLARAIKLKSILFDVCDKAEFNKVQGVRLHQFILNKPKWRILEELYALLAVCTPIFPFVQLLTLSLHLADLSQSHHGHFLIIYPPCS